MSKKNKDVKGTAKAKSAEELAKQPATELGAKGDAKELAVIKIPSPSARRAADGAEKQPASSTGEPAAAAPKRKLGLRGAAPWAARHAAKHAAEARARAAEPPPPGSARATIRVPNGAEELKAKIAELHNALLQIRSYRKNLNKGFHDIGGVLKDIQQRKLYEAKGYGSFEAFLERENDLGKTTALKLIRAHAVFVKAAALEYGMERVLQALQVLEASPEPVTKSGPAPASTQPSSPRVALPLKPPLGRVG
jgi:hypothetical protein